MRIEDKAKVGVDAYIHEIKDRVKIERTSPKKGPQSGEGKERVELSSRAREIHKARRLLEKVPDVRADKVARIKKAIEEGTYEVSSREVASSMLREALLDQIL